MKWFLILWAAPLALLGSWYGLSYYDISFGTRILSRDLHDLVFLIYGNLLGIEPELIPGLVLKAVIVDSALVFGIILLRRYWRRRRLVSVFQELLPSTETAQSGRAGRDREASLSSAP